jgi:hypothetical protein
MKQMFFLLGAAALLMCSPAPASAADGPLFGCGARAPNVCYFRIFYQRGGRIVILPAGMKNKVPGVLAGKDQYCVALGKTPAFSCTRKIVNATSNS